jgi:hypothetical protein
MMANIIPFESAKLPANVAAMFSVSSDLITARGGYPTVSIKGKVFHIVRGEERTLLTKPGEEDPAGSMEVIIVKANPNLSKVFYAKGYEEGSDAKPDCYSNDGLAPADDAEIPQAKKCATCKHNQWGSRITDSGGKGKACSDSQRLAVSPVGLVNDPMLLRVPAASLKALTQYGETLKKRGVPFQVVVTRVGFDYSVAHPALTFKPVGFIDDDTAMQVKEVHDSSVVDQITGVAAYERPAAPAVEDDNEDFEQAPPPKKEAAKPAKAAPVEVEEEEPAPPKKATKPAQEVLEPEVEEAPAAPVKKAAAVEVDSSLVEDISSVLDELNFDDE